MVDIKEDFSVKGYVFLAISIVSEVFATMMLKLSDGFTIIGPSLAVAWVTVFHFIACRSV